MIFDELIVNLEKEYSMKLDSCPFCNGKANITADYICDGWWVGAVICNTCFAQLNSTSGDTPEEALKHGVWAWNRRVGE